MRGNIGEKVFGVMQVADKISGMKQGLFVCYSRWIGICLVFFALPLLLLSIGLGRNWRRVETNSYNSAFNYLDKRILHIKRFEKAEYFFATILKLAFQKAEQSKDFHRTLKKYLTELKHNFPGIFHFYVTTPDNEIFYDLSDSNVPKTILKKLSGAFSNSSDFSDNLKASWGVLKGFIGNIADFEQITKPLSNCIEVSSDNPKRWFFWQIGKYGKLFVHIDHNKSWSIIPINYLCKNLNKKTTKTNFRLDFYEYGTASLASLFPERVKKFIKTSMHQVSDDSGLYVFQNIGVNAILQASVPLSTLENRHLHRIVLFLFVTVVFSYLCLKTFQVMILGTSFRIPIALRTNILFLFVAMAPLTLTILSAWDYLQSFYDARNREFQSVSEETLRSIDLRFPKMLKKIENLLGRIAKSSDYSNSSERKIVTRRLKKLAELVPIEDCYIVASDGSIIWSLKTPDEKSRQFRSVTRVLCPDLLRAFNRSDASFGVVKSNNPQDFKNSALDEKAAADFADSLGKMKEFWYLSKKKTFVWQYPFLREKNNLSEFMFVLHFNLDLLEELFFTRYLKKRPLKINHTAIMCNRSSGLQIISGNVSKSHKYEYFLNALSVFQNEAFEVFPQRNGVNWLVMSVPSKEFENVYFAAILSDEFIRKEQTKTAAIIAFCVFLYTSISLYFSFLLSKDLFEPIANISNGVKAISLHAFRHRIPIEEHKDEFLELSKTFNGVLESLEDLELGRIVQESIFPESTIRSKEFEVFGHSFPATQLGGDYFDLRQFPDGRLLIMIADVSGHGVPAGLIMAMVRALTDASLFQNRFDLISLKPETILSFIQEFLFTKLVNCHNTLCCFVAIVDPEAKGFYFANAGHCKPLLFNISGIARTISVPFSKPLELGRQPSLGLGFQKLEPEDLILFYTNGITNSKSPNAQNPDLDFLLSVTSGLNHNLSDSIAKIMACFKRFTENKPQEDDITLILLGRGEDPSENNK
ncbi:MAG: SpoIIE family protein phosphatase [Candidatus Riflebacteria bacterium]|nr:SpoIIE family protein phosphatase [Candidatus Riflebacteria bacterium]